MHGCNFGAAEAATSSKTDNLKQLSTKNRHRIRAMMNLSVNDGLKVFNIFRANATPWEIYHAQVALTETPYHSFKVADIFPETPQVKENYHRLAPLELNKQVAILELYAKNNLSKLLSFCDKVAALNTLAMSGGYESADEVIAEIEKEFGYSHFLLRKACWIKSESPEEALLPAINGLLTKNGIGEKNVITTSIVNCFSEAQDYLALRKSMLAITPKGIKGVRNQFTRDIVRQIFHPHANNASDLATLLQSLVQSSLIDALISFKINRAYFADDVFPSCDFFCEALEGVAIGVDQLAGLYVSKDDSEGIFFQKTGAWLESSEIINYRLLNDYFYDPLFGSNLDTDHPILSKCEKICQLSSISELSTAITLTTHSFPNLRQLEREGLVTRSAAFNFILFKNEGFDNINQEALLWLMGHTRDLYRTINLIHAKRLAGRLKSRLSKIIIFLLIIKRTRDDLSANRLTRLLEDEIIENHSSDLMIFMEDLGRRHLSIALYLHEVCTEDFLARLTRVIPETKLITDTRAKLHEWRGKETGDNNLLDRARAIRIDYKISLVRGEIDDNRIYVDPSRFLEWISDNISVELTPVLTSISHNLNPEEKVDDAQLRDLVSRCYSEFCSNKHYGIASYIGRRIRHGTFKGHVFTNALIFEKNHKEFLSDTDIATRYNVWRSGFESLVSFAVNEKLHIENNVKSEGLIKPNLKSAAKQEFLTACMSDIVKVFRSQGATNNLPAVILEYCWRIVELDLSAIRSYIKEMKSKLAQNELYSDLKRLSLSDPQLCVAFTTDLQTALNKQFKVALNWFKRPPSVSPKADINLLYKAVIREVQETYQDFYTEADYDEEDDLQLFGEVYHRIYDALFVIIFNAAKHGRPGSPLERDFLFEKSRDERIHLILNISSQIRNEQSEIEVCSMLSPGPAENISNAQTQENRSGIPKLYNLTLTDQNFSVEHINCAKRKVTIAVSYRMDH